MSPSKYVYDFSEGNASMKPLLGGKGANLAEMTGLGIPVPPGFIVTQRFSPSDRHSFGCGPARKESAAVKLAFKLAALQARLNESEERVPTFGR